VVVVVGVLVVVVGVLVVVVGVAVVVVVVVSCSSFKSLQLHILEQ